MIEIPVGRMDSGADLKNGQDIWRMIGNMHIVHETPKTHGLQV